MGDNNGLRANKGEITFTLDSLSRPHQKMKEAAAEWRPCTAGATALGIMSLAQQ